MRIEQNYSLTNHNTFQLPTTTRWFVEYDCEEELSHILQDDFFLKNRSLSIGEGSNLLFVNDFDGIIIHSCIREFAVTDKTSDSVVLRVGSGVHWDDVVVFAVSQGWGGIENLSYIPGEAGAAAIQNIGAYGVEIKEVIETVEAIHQLTGKKHIFTVESCKYSYRHSYFKELDPNPFIITSISLRLQKRPQYRLDYGNLASQMSRRDITLQSVRDAVIEIRRSRLPEPGVLGNAGSFFVNPVISRKHFDDLKSCFPSIPSYPAPDGTVKVPAGWLIEQCGFKGKREGNVGVYEKQALILVNHGGATGKEIASFARTISRTINETFGIVLVPEVKYVI